MKISFTIYFCIVLFLINGLNIETSRYDRNNILYNENSYVEKSDLGENTNRISDLSEINTWLCVYSCIRARNIVNTEFDLVDVDPDEFTYDDIFNIKNSDKIIIAYISIGEAEEYRYYWDPNVDYLLEENPDWPECWYVDYSSKEWQDMIIYNYIPQIKEKGFDGLFIDTVDTYHLVDKYPNCSKENMISFIKNISFIHKSLEFYIILQNGLEIASEIVDYIDGICFEETYYRAFYIHFLGFHINGIPQNPFLRIDKEKVMQKILDENKLVLTLDYANLRFQVEHCYRNSRSN